MFRYAVTVTPTVVSSAPLSGGWLREEWRNQDNELHRDFGPAVTVFNPDKGATARLEYYRLGQLHRSDGPAEIEYRSDRMVETWYIGGALSRAEGPAIVERDRETGRVLSEEWYLDGLRHREDGPAYTAYNEDDPDEVLREEHHVRGKEIGAEKFRPGERRRPFDKRPAPA